MKVRLLEKELDVVIVRKNNKNIYFRVTDDMVLYVTCHYLVSDEEIEKLILKNKKSILRMYDNALKKVDAKKVFSYLGDEYTFVIDEFVDNVLIENGFVMAKSMDAFNKFWLSECLRIFEMRLEACKTLFSNLPTFRLRVRKMKTRWGVNNFGSRTVTLNSDLLRYEISVIDYVIIHELCHFIYQDHSKNFWSEVGKRYPYYKLARKKLKEI